MVGGGGGGGVAAGSGAGQASAAGGGGGGGSGYEALRRIGLAASIPYTLVWRALVERQEGSNRGAAATFPHSLDCRSTAARVEAGSLLRQRHGQHSGGGIGGAAAAAILIRRVKWATWASAIRTPSRYMDPGNGGGNYFAAGAGFNAFRAGLFAGPAGNFPGGGGCGSAQAGSGGGVTTGGAGAAGWHHPEGIFLMAFDFPNSPTEGSLRPDQAARSTSTRAASGGCRAPVRWSPPRRATASSIRRMQISQENPKM